MLDEDLTRDLLSQVEAPPSRLTVTELLATGKRHRTRRRLVSVALAVTIVGAIGLPMVLTGPRSTPTPGTEPSPSSTGVPQCLPQLLTIPGTHDDVDAVAVDPTGRYIAGFYRDGKRRTPVLWTDGRYQRIQPADLKISGVNANGIVVGNEASAGFGTTVWRYADGHATALHNPAGVWTDASSPRINSRGDVMVTLQPVSGINGAGLVTVLWRAGTTEPTAMSVPDDFSLLDLADNGDMVGTGPHPDAYIYHADGTRTALPTNGAAWVSTEAFAGDWVVGEMWSGTSSQNQQVMWNRRTHTLHVLDGMSGPVAAANANGWVISTAGLVWNGSAFVNINPDMPGNVPEPRGISDTSVIVGHMSGPTTGAAIWRC